MKTSQTRREFTSKLAVTVRPGGDVLPENVERDLPLAAKAIRKAGLEGKQTNSNTK